jgi:hypothetical protein
MVQSPKHGSAFDTPVALAFSADRADQALRITILTRRAWRGWVIANPERMNASNKCLAITGIPIVDQMARICSQPQAAVSWLAIHSAVG